MDDITLGRAATLKWIREYITGIIENHADDWTPDEVAETVDEAADDLQKVAEGPKGARWIISDCAMASTGYNIKQL